MNRQFAAVAAAVLAVAAALAGCAPLVVAGAAAGGALVATDRRTSGTQVEDETIELKAGSRVGDLATLGSVSVTSFNRTVLVTGQVPTATDKARVADAVAKVENVRAVVDEVEVGPNASLTTRSNDSIISGKVKASFVDTKDLQSNAVKVVTERGVVYLMGVVTEREANRASDVARTVGGVQKVVRVFEVVSEAELAGTKPPSSAASAVPAGTKPR